MKLNDEVIQFCTRYIPSKHGSKMVVCIPPNYEYDHLQIRFPWYIDENTYTNVVVKIHADRLICGIPYVSLIAKNIDACMHSVHLQLCVPGNNKWWFEFTSDEPEGEYIFHSLLKEVDK